MNKDIKNLSIRFKNIRSISYYRDTFNNTNTFDRYIPYIWEISEPASIHRLKLITKNSYKYIFYKNYTIISVKDIANILYIKD